MRITFIFLYVVVFSSTVQALTTVTASHAFSPAVTNSFNIGAGMGIDGATVYDNRIAQSFTATTDGFLNTISFVARKYTGTTADLRVTLTDLSGSQPGVTLASGLIDVGSIPDEDFRNWGIHFTGTVFFQAEDILLEAGKQYAFVFSTDMTNANYRIYGDYSGYTLGNTMRFQNGSYNSIPGDLFFEVTVNTLPEPSVLTLMMLGIIFLNRRKKD